MEQMKHYIVTEPCKFIKKIARQSLKGHWGTAILAALVFHALTILPLVLEQLFSSSILINLLGYMYRFVVYGALMFGMASCFLKTFRQQNAGIKECFSGFNYLSKCIILYIIKTLITMLLYLLLVIPGIIASYRFRFAFTILADDPSKAPLQCLRESSVMAMGNKFKMFKLDLSFIIIDLICAAPATGILSSYYSYIFSNYGFEITDMEAMMNEMISDPMVAVYGLLLILSSIFFVFAEAYAASAQMCMYEMIKGNLITADAAGTGSNE